MYHDAGAEKNIADDLKKASDELKKENKAKAKPNQKKAAGKMKAMAKRWRKACREERRNRWKKTKMLRQVLDNLLAFIAGICDGTIQGSQKRFSAFNKTSNCNRT
jgi:hypothetical protein